MASKYKSLLVIIPAYNEDKIIDRTIINVIKELNKLKIISDLLLIDDGSSDETLRIISKQSKKINKLKYISHNKNMGYGAAISSGLKYANKNNYYYSLFMDSDLTNDPKDIHKFVKEFENEYDCIKASRYIKGGKIKNVPIQRVLISKIGNLLASKLYNVGVKDCTNGFLMVKTNIFKNIKLEEKSFAIIMEEMYHLKKEKANFKEIPVTLHNRKTGKSNFIYKPIIFYDYIKYPLKSLI